MMGMITVAENDVVSLTHQMTSGSAIQIPSAETGLTIVYAKCSIQEIRLLWEKLQLLS